MAGYSGKPLVQKLGIKPGFCIFVDGLSMPYREVVGELPDDVTIAKTARAPLDMVHVFAAEAKGLAARLRSYRKAIAPDGMIWASWPKKASGVATDVTETLVRETALANGLVDIKVCAVDDVWSGLKLVIPVKDRAKLVK
jgi:coenzyme F420-reducing hydrogenase beta subunit